MAENAAPVTTTPAAASPAPAAPVPGVLAPRPPTIFEAAKARAFAAVEKELVPHVPPVAAHASEVDGKRTGQPPGAPPSIDMDPETLRQVTKLSAEKRALEARLKELEPASAAAATLAEVRKLYAAGKKIEAVALLADSKDATAEMEGLLADFIGRAEPKEITAADIAKRLDDEKKASNDAKAKADAEAAEKAKGAEQEAAKTAATAYVASIIGELAAQYEHAGKAERRAEAAPAVLAAVTALREAKGLTDDDLATPEATRALIEEAIDEVEVEYTLEAAREATREAVKIRKGALQTSASGAGSTSGQRGNPADSARRDQPETRQTTPTLPRPGITTQPRSRYLTHDAAKAKAKEAFRAGTVERR